MLESFFAYIEWVELETFFSGYLLVYAIVYLVSLNKAPGNFFKKRVFPNLPLAYAFSGTLYWGLQLKNAYPVYDISGIAATTQFPLLKLLGLASILFWIPFFYKKVYLSLLHSFVFFFLMVRSLYLPLAGSSGANDMTRNSIKIYSVSILINLATLILVVFISILISRYKRSERSSHS